jgi:hypothetical protein
MAALVRLGMRLTRISSVQLCPLAIHPLSAINGLQPVRGKHSRNVKIKPAGGAPQLFREEDLSEQFMRGSGKGGQSVAKTNNCVQLIHRPTGIIIKCHATRSRDLNRRLARQELQHRLDDLARGPDSVRNRRAARDKKKAMKQRQRSKAKYGAPKGSADGASVRGDAHSAASPESREGDDSSGGGGGRGRGRGTAAGLWWAAATAPLSAPALPSNAVLQQYWRLRRNSFAADAVADSQEEKLRYHHPSLWLQVRRGRLLLPPPA